MDRETQLRRTINYLKDFMKTTDDLMRDSSKVTYFEYHQRYEELKNYLLAYSKISDSLINMVQSLPVLLRPSAFNKEPGALWTISILGLVNPFFVLLILTITFPISLPYVFIRALTVNRTKSRVDEAKPILSQILNKLMEASVE